MEYNASKSVGLLNIFRMNRYAGLHGNLAEGRIKSLLITKPNQVVFSSINYGTDTSAEGRLVIKELLTCTMQGVGNGATAIFPIHVMKMKEGVNKNPGDPNYDLYKMSWAVTARRFFPNYLNLDATFNRDDRWRAEDPLRYNYEVATMGCRTRTWSDRFGLPTSIGRGNLSFTSINLPKIAIETAIETGAYVKSEDGYVFNPDCTVPMEVRVANFKVRLKKYADLVAKQLDDRYKFQATALKEQFPLLMSGVWMGSENLKRHQTVEEVIKHGTLGVSFIGLAEALIMLTGKHHGESDESQAIGLDIIGYLNDLCKGYSDEYDHNYSCFATPAEGLSGRFTVVDAKKYGIIKHVTDKEYYTNSSHVPVWYQCTPAHKAEIEGPYHALEPAGHIFYVEADADLTKNPEYVDAVNRMAWDNNVGYSSINHTQGRCKDCNYESNDPNLHRFGSTCPHCGGEWTTLDRVTGYLSSTYDKQSFGKKAEILDRVVHK
jgi:ribonucleoside-triphosphate reductase